MRESITNRLRCASLILLCSATPAAAFAQSPDSVVLSSNYWQLLGLGATTSILLHEMGHITTAFALGSHPTFGFDTFRPTVYSNIDSHRDPHKQFLFSAAGLTVQTLLDEAILDIPHTRGAAFERGLLAGGIGTTVFYLTIGRNGTVSDVDFMARTHALTKTQITLIYGSFALMHTVRISRDKHYANFFARPRDDGRLDVGVGFGVP